MGYMTDGLTFNVLREANKKRMETSYPVCKDWTAAQWLQALIGELGEYANIRKKFERGDFDEEEFKKQAQKELADCVAYLDILCEKLGINLGEATVNKFNEISDRISSEVYIKEGGYDWYIKTKNK